MADRIVLNRTNTELLAANTRKKQRAQRTGTQYDGQGDRLLSLEDVEKRRQLAENKKKEKEARSQVRKEKQNDRLFSQVSKDLMRLGPDLIYGPYLVTSRSLPKNKQRDDSIFQNAFHDLLHIIPHIFEETVEGDLGFKKTALNKGKCISRKKYTTELVQGDVEIVGNGEKEEVLEVRVSSRGRVIRNTRKL